MNRQKTAVVFPGQGSQRTGMGKDFYDQLEVSRKTYEEASDALGWDVGSLCFENDERIDLTRFAQPCILATEMAMYRGIQYLSGFHADYYGGHSLGEYAALVAAGAMPFADALKVVEARGQLMQAAVPPGEGAMTAVIGENLDIDAIQLALADLPVDMANINSSDQVVISGQARGMDTAQNGIRQAFDHPQGLRFVPLNISAPFHSRYMKAIGVRFRALLEKLADRLHPERAGRVASNYTGGFHDGRLAGLIDALVAQLSNSVKWRDNMAALAERAHMIYEIGPNRPLKAFFKSIGVKCTSITKYAEAKREIVL
jgi:[acyl-carrier-protein] S-malonyltransferase/trans-AT polyketide synthase/acyltransferase/oxidoreductase domain-containing protein